jgi:OOP family OmpA-OmpF porin
MKKDPSVKFIVNGYASIEGTEQHNMVLSQDRANSVKAYLVNSGIPAANLITKGNGTANPIADNNTEAGRILNRRVEIKKQ